MKTIKDTDGNVIREVRRFTGIRKYAADVGIKQIHVDIKNGFWMAVIFSNATFCRMKFDKFKNLIGTLKGWRKAQGVSLLFNQSSAGTVNEKSMAQISGENNAPGQTIQSKTNGNANVPNDGHNRRKGPLPVGSAALRH